MSDVIEDLGSDEGNEGQLDPALLAEAAEQGWVPQDKWQGKPEEWSDAETFVRRGREINPILRKALKKERERTAALEADLRATGATVAELREYLSKVEERATKNALASLKKARSDALAAGDHDSAAQYEEQIDELKDSPSAVPKATPAPQAQQMHPEVAAWMSRNPWFNDENPELVEYANGATIALMQAKQRAGQTYTPQEILDQVTAKVKKVFPKAFGGDEPPARMFESGGSSAGSSGASRGTGGKTAFDKLPAEARAQFKRFYNAGYYVDVKTRKPLDEKAAQAEYLKEYE
jgi:hypothetical protein